MAEGTAEVPKVAVDVFSEGSDVEVASAALTLFQ